MPRVQGDIPAIDYPKALKDKGRHKDVIDDFLCRLKRAEFRKGYGPEDLPVYAGVSLAFVDWTGELGTIVDNLNIAIVDLRGLGSQRSLPPRELWSRYRLLARIAIYEFYRIKDVLSRFLKQLKSLGVIDEKCRKGLQSEILNVLKPMIGVRNQITHSYMHILVEEEQARLVTLGADVGFAYVDRTGQIIEPWETVGKLATRIADEFTTISKETVVFLQSFTDRLAAYIAQE